MSRTGEHYHHAARHHEKAAYHYKEAAKYDQAEELEKAAHHAYLAHGHKEHASRSSARSFLAPGMSPFIAPSVCTGPPLRRAGPSMISIINLLVGRSWSRTHTATALAPEINMSAPEIGRQPLYAHFVLCLDAMCREFG
jgi:hypothetical protein